MPAISRNPLGSYKRHPGSVASVSEQTRSTGKIACPAMSNLGKSAVALSVITEFKKTTTATATETSLNKRFHEQNNGCARAL